MPKGDKLSAKERLFIAAYLELRDGAKAVRAAGYKMSSDDQARNKAWALQQKATIAQAIQAGIKEIEKRHQVNADKIERELCRIGFADIAQICSWDADGIVSMRPSADMPLRTRRAIASIKQTSTEHGKNIEVKLWPKQPALETLAKRHRFFETAPDDGKKRTRVISLVIDDVDTDTDIGENDE